MKVAIIGAGAAGLFAAGLIANKGHEVIVFDGNEKCGKKLYITGKGRCNFTNVCDNQTFISNVVRGEKFLLSALSRFTPYDSLAFFEEQGVKAKIERGNRAFPESDKSSDIIKALTTFAKKAKIKLEHKVNKIVKTEIGFLVDGESFDRVIIATGGKSYPATGSTGDGYRLAREFGHTIVPLQPALVPIELADEYIKELQGLSLKNVSLTAVCDGKRISRFGEMLFTDKGISGPIVLTLSSLINRLNCQSLEIDFKPALSEAQLDARLLREFENNKNKNISAVMFSLLPKSMAAVFMAKLKINPAQKVNSVTVDQRQKIIKGLKCWTLKYKMLYPIEAGVVTSGGVDLREVEPKTMQSKLAKGLHFVGEVLDIDALTGGFNLQIAFSTAYAAAQDF